jgi:hypothetical protein
MFSYLTPVFHRTTYIWVRMYRTPTTYFTLARLDVLYMLKAGENIPVKKSMSVMRGIKWKKSAKFLLSLVACNDAPPSVLPSEWSFEEPSSFKIEYNSFKIEYSSMSYEKGVNETCF